MMLWAQLVAYKLFVYPRTTALAQSVFRYLTTKGAVVGSSSRAEFEPIMARDFFKDMSSLQARLGFVRIQKIEQNISYRKKMAELYDQLLEEKGWKARFYDRQLSEPVMVRYPVRIAQKHRALSEPQEQASSLEAGSNVRCTPLKRLWQFMTTRSECARKLKKQATKL
jgi:dTDP-4-amino-4,6-dideoxygalactose transaminase